jgi:hypothetical protein
LLLISILLTTDPPPPSSSNNNKEVVDDPSPTDDDIDFDIDCRAEQRVLDEGGGSPLCSFCCDVIVVDIVEDGNARRSGGTVGWDCCESLRRGVDVGGAVNNPNELSDNGWPGWYDWIR